MKTFTSYVAVDGTVFDNFEACDIYNYSLISIPEYIRNKIHWVKFRLINGDSTIDEILPFDKLTPKSIYNKMQTHWLYIEDLEALKWLHSISPYLNGTDASIITDSNLGVGLNYFNYDGDYQEVENIYKCIEDLQEDIDYAKNQIRHLESLINLTGGIK